MNKIDFNELIKSYKPEEIYNGNVDKYNIEILKQYKVIIGYVDLAYSNVSLKDSIVEVVAGSFDCSENKLKNLEGCPKYIGIDFNCSLNELESLIGSPLYVNGDFDCTECKKLKSLQGVSKFIGGDFNCYNIGKLNLQETIKVLNDITVEGSVVGDMALSLMLRYKKTPNEYLRMHKYNIKIKPLKELED